MLNTYIENGSLVSCSIRFDQRRGESRTVPTATDTFYLSNRTGVDVIDHEGDVRPNCNFVRSTISSYQ